MPTFENMSTDCSDCSDIGIESFSTQAVLNELSSRFKAQEDERRSKEQEHQAKITTLEQRIDTLHNDLQEYMKFTDHLNDDIADLKTENKNLRRANAELEQHVQTLEDKIFQLEHLPSSDYENTNPESQQPSGSTSADHQN